MPKVSRLEVIATGSRRRWTVQEKERIVAESFALPRNASSTARRYGLSAGQLFTWRRLAREGKLGLEEDDAGFVPAIVAADHCGGGPQTPPARLSAVIAVGGRMEIVLSSARRVIVGGDVDLVALARVIEVLERQ